MLYEIHVKFSFEFCKVECRQIDQPQMESIDTLMSVIYFKQMLLEQTNIFDRFSVMKT